MSDPATAAAAGLVGSAAGQLPALAIMAPLVAAPLCVIARNARVAWWIALLASALATLCAWRLLGAVDAGAPVRYAVGGWAPPAGIELYVDFLNATVLVLVAAISTVALVYARRSVETTVELGKRYLFWAAWCLCLTGLLGITITGDAFNVFVFLEISSLSTYMLVSFGDDRRALSAAFRYVILGSVGASFILIGIGFLYAATGTLNMVDIAHRLPGIGESRTVLVAFSFLTIGLMIKAAIFPLHAWLPNAYQYAPIAATVFLAGTATKVSLYVLIRFFHSIFGVEYSFGQLFLNGILLPAAVAGFRRHEPRRGVPDRSSAHARVLVGRPDRLHRRGRRARDRGRHRRRHGARRQPRHRQGGAVHGHGLHPVPTRPRARAELRRAVPTHAVLVHRVRARRCGPGRGAADRGLRQQVRADRRDARARAVAGRRARAAELPAGGRLRRARRRDHDLPPLAHRRRTRRRARRGAGVDAGGDLDHGRGDVLGRHPRGRDARARAPRRRRRADRARGRAGRGRRGQRDGRGASGGPGRPGPPRRRPGDEPARHARAAAGGGAADPDPRGAPQERARGLHHRRGAAVPGGQRRGLPGDARGRAGDRRRARDARGGSRWRCRPSRWA